MFRLPLAGRRGPRPQAPRDRRGSETARTREAGVSDTDVDVTCREGGSPAVDGVLPTVPTDVEAGDAPVAVVTLLPDGDVGVVGTGGLVEEEEVWGRTIPFTPAPRGPTRGRVTDRVDGNDLRLQCRRDPYPPSGTPSSSLAPRPSARAPTGRQRGGRWTSPLPDRRFSGVVRTAGSGRESSGARTGVTPQSPDRRVRPGPLRTDSERSVTSPESMGVQEREKTPYRVPGFRSRLEETLIFRDLECTRPRVYTPGTSPVPDPR